MKCKYLSKIGFQIFMNPSSFRSTMNPMRSSSTFHVPPELTEILQAKSHNYKRYYLTLKSQQTVIQNFLENLSKTVIDDDDKPTVATIESCANSLLNCTYGELLIITASTQNLVNSMISNSHGNKPIDKLIYHLLNSVMAINKLFTSIQNEFSKMPQIHDSSSNDSLDSLQNSPNNSLQTNHDNNNANLTENFNGFEREENSEKSIIAHSPNTDLGLRGTILNFSDFDHNSTSNGNNNSNEKGESDSDIICEDDTILCRICDEHVRIDQFAEHTESCIKAYKYEEKIMLIYNRMLDLQNQICEYHLRVNWPGNAKEAVQVYLPLFRCSLLLERANEIDPKNEDAAEELGFIADIMTQISMSLIKSSMSELIMQIKEQVIAKKNTSIVIRRAAAVLKNTRISGNADTNKSSQINISDFDFIKRISSGAFARVFLAKKKVSSDIYAIKVLPKDDVVQKNQVKRVVLEKDILLKFNNPYIINFYYSISGTKNLYLVMEYLPGGDLYSLLQECGSLDEHTSKIYTFQIATALAYLHSHGIIHRDIKPDNILISADGTLKLTDFGLSYIGLVGRHIAKEDDDGNLVKSNSMVGTPDYIAPEIVLNHEHSFTVDWWSLGVMIYEFFYGTPPFHSDTEKQIHDNIIHGRYTFPDENPKQSQNDQQQNSQKQSNERVGDGDEEDYQVEISDVAKDLIRRLLEVDPKKRIGAHGSGEVLRHPWFSGLKIGEIEAPFVPTLRNAEDTQYFQTRYQFNENDDSDILCDINDSSSSRAKVNHNRSRSVTGSSLLMSQSLLKSGSFQEGESESFDEMANFPSLSVSTAELENQFPSIAISQLENINKKALRKLKDKVPPASKSFAAISVGKEKIPLPDTALKQRRSFLVNTGTVDDMLLPSPRPSLSSNASANED